MLIIAVNALSWPSPLPPADHTAPGPHPPVDDGRIVPMEVHQTLQDLPGVALEGRQGDACCVLAADEAPQGPICEQLCDEHQHLTLAVVPPIVQTHHVAICRQKQRGQQQQPQSITGCVHCHC